MLEYPALHCQHGIVERVGEPLGLRVDAVGEVRDPVPFDLGLLSPFLSGDRRVPQPHEPSTFLSDLMPVPLPRAEHGLGRRPGAARLRFGRQPLVQLSYLRRAVEPAALGGGRGLGLPLSLLLQ